MRISLNWLKDYIDLKGIPEKELLERLTLSTCEVEDVRKLDEHIKNTVVGEILKIEQHPNADKLKVCTVRVKSQKSKVKSQGIPSTSSGSNYSLSGALAESKGGVINIICGGTNLRAGAKVVVSLPGAAVKWHGENTWTELKETEIRGVKSVGMICAAEELEIAWRHEDADGERPIMVLPDEAPVGESVVEYLGLADTVLDIDNKSITHRADLFSHVGIATEFGAIFKKGVQDGRYLEHTPAFGRPSQEGNIKNPPRGMGGRAADGVGIDVRIEAKDTVKRYSAFLIENVKIVASPLWMQNRLRAVGIRSINNMVDATNYVMWEYGQPLHAFDARKLANQREGGREPKQRPLLHPPLTKGSRNDGRLGDAQDTAGGVFVLRYAKKGEKVTTLDNTEHELNETMLVAVDREGNSIDLPGIMGGKASEVDENTSSILLQAAVFDRVAIRKMSLALAHRTEASGLYERGVDPNLTLGALTRTLELLKETCPEANTVQMIDEYPEPLQDRELEFDPAQIQKQLGIEISHEEAKGILERLGFSISSLRDSAKQPRSDAQNEISTSSTSRSDNSLWSIIVPARRKDVFGFQDICEEVGRIYGYDNITPQQHSAPLRAPVVPQSVATREEVRDLLCRQNFHEVYQYIFLSDRDIAQLKFRAESLVQVQNPISEDLKYLRPSLLPSFLKTIEKNEGRFDSFSLFEVGKVFAPEAHEREHVGGVIVGAQLEEELLRRAFGVWDEMVRVLKLPVEFTRAPLEEAGETFASSKWLTVTSSTAIKIGKRIAGVLGMVKPKTANAFGVKGMVSCFELDLELLAELRENRREYERLPQFPSILRDIALVLDQTTQYEQVAQILSKTEYLKHFELFDVFSGKGIPSGKKSLTFHLEFSVPERTLTSKEVDEVLRKALQNLEHHLGATLRS